MTCAIEPFPMEHQWRSPVCSTIEISLGQVMAQNRAPLHHRAMARQWRNQPRAYPSTTRYAPAALCLWRRLQAHRSHRHLELGAGMGRGRKTAGYRHAHVDIQARADRTHARPTLGAIARGRDSLAAVDRHSTAANAPTHQRHSQRFCSLCNPRRFPACHSCTALRGNSVRHQHLALSRSANSLCWGHIGRVLRARYLNNLRKLDERARERARGSQPATSPILALSWINNRVGVGVGRNQRPFAKSISSPNFAAAVSKIWAARFCRTSLNIVEHCMP